jgi:hypothetical protein
MLDLGFITEEDKVDKCIELTKEMYGNIDSPLRWMKHKTFNVTDTITTKYDRPMLILQDQEQQGSFDSGYVCG